MREVRTPTASHKTRETMKQVVLRIDDAAYEKFMGMVSLCPMVEVVNVCQAKDARQMTNHYVMAAIREMRKTRAFRLTCALT